MKWDIRNAKHVPRSCQLRRGWQLRSSWPDFPA